MDDPRDRQSVGDGPVPGAGPGARPSPSPPTPPGLTAADELGGGAGAPGDGGPGGGPGGPGRGHPYMWLVYLVAGLLLATVIVVQRPGAGDPKAAEDERTGAVVEPPGFDLLVPFAKVAMFLKGQMREAGTAPAAAAQGEMAKLAESIDGLAGSAADRFRVALLAGEVAGPAARRTRLDQLEGSLDPASPLREDIRLVEGVDGAGAEQEDAGGPDAAGSGPDVAAVLAARAAAREEAIGRIDPAAREAFAHRHGWFARLFLSRQSERSGAAFDAEAREEGVKAAVVLCVFVVGVGLALLTGLVLLVVTIVTVATGRLRSRFRPTPTGAGAGPDRGLWLETFAVFMVGFLALHFGRVVLSSRVGADEVWPVYAGLGAQWLLAGAVFWPLARGMPWDRFRSEIGWHAGQGFWHEVGSGVMAWLAGLPVMVGVSVLALLLYALSRLGLDEPGGLPRPDTRIIEIIAGANVWGLLLLASMLSVWAPLVEESIFRGALFRHLRTRLRGPGGLALTVAVVALSFGLAHPYPFVQVAGVASLGMMFALTREWRGSLIAPITAHFLQNTLVFILLVSLISLMK